MSVQGNNSSLQLVERWLKETIIGLDLCPFARLPYERGLIRVVESFAADEDEQLQFFLEELDYLNDAGPSEVATTLISYPNASKDFLDFYYFVGDLEEMLKEASLDNVFQLVAFHPRFIFEGTEENEVGNFVNRSPVPVLHIIRFSDIAKALKNPQDGEIISFNNLKKLEEMSLEELKKHFSFETITKNQ